MASRVQYVKLTWVNDETKLNALNLNHIEEGIYNNNLLSIENANYIDEIYSSLIDKLQFDYNAQTGKLILIFGDNTLPRFKATKEIALTNHFYNKSSVDTLIASQSANIEQHYVTIEDEEYVIDEEDR